MIEKRVRDWVVLQREKGRTDNEIYNIMLKNGYSKESAMEALNDLKKNYDATLTSESKVKKSFFQNKKFLIFLIIWAVLFIAWLAWGYILFLKA